MKTFFSLVTILTLLLGATGAARGQEIVCPKPSGDPEYNKNEARSYYNMGNTFFTMKQYEKSAASFVCVINLVPYSIMARYRLGKSYDGLGRFSLAREQYQWILADASDEASVLKAEVQKRFDEIKSLPDKAAEPVTADPVTADPAPGDGDPGKDPGKDPGTGEKTDGKQPGTTRPPVTAPASPRPALTSRWWFWTGVGATAVFTGAVLFAGWQTLEYQDRWETDWKPADRDALKNYRMITDLSIAGAVISAAALGIAVWLDRPKAAPGPSGKSGNRWFVLPACGPDNCGLSLTWEF